jgi:arylformamidase
MALPQRHSPEWFDAQYDNRARVADSAEVLARWAQASQLVREREPCVLDQRYGEGPKETLDIFTTDVSQAPVLVFIHGGWWRSLDKSDHSFLGSVFTHEGALLVVPNYELAPKASLERMALQVAQSLVWVWRHIAEYGGDPNRIVLAGHSAGGHLAAMMSSCDWKSIAPELPRHLVKGVLSISGVHDLAPVAQAPFLREDLRLDAAAVQRLSPVGFPAPDAPFYAVVGEQESEEFRRQTKLLRKAWGRRAVPVCEEVPGFNHFTILHDLADPQGRTHQLARRLLDLRWYSALL